LKTSTASWSSNDFDRNDEQQNKIKIEMKQKSKGIEKTENQLINSYDRNEKFNQNYKIIYGNMTYNDVDEFKLKAFKLKAIGNAYEKEYFFLRL